MKVKKTRVIAAFIVLIALAVGLWRDATEKVESATVPESHDAVSEKESIEEARAIASTNGAPEAEIASAEEKVDAVEPSVATNAVKISYKKVDKSIPRLRQAATANRLYIAPESGRLVEEKFAATQEPSARGTVPYVLIPASEIDDIHHERLASMGVRELGYFPPNGMLVELTEDQFNAVAKDDMFSLVGEWSATDKVEPHVGMRTENGEYRLTVITCEGSDVENVASAVAGLGGAVETKGTSDTGWLRVKLPAEDGMVAELAKYGEIRWIEPYYQPHVVNNYAVRPDHLNVTPVWNTHGLTGTNQIVCVADSGLDTGDKDTVLADFRGRVLDIIQCYETPADYGGHGTHVAGSVFGNGATSDGTYRGVAYEAKGLILSCGAASQTSDSLSIPEDVFTYQIGTYNFRIQNNSWGQDDNGYYGWHSSLADSSSVSNPGLLIAIAGGNTGDETAYHVGSPGTSKNALTVGSCDNKRDWGYVGFTGNPDNRSDFSSYGTTEEGRFKPDLLSVGFGVVSTRSTMCARSWYSSLYTNTLFLTGTSMATPLAAGCATLVRQWLVERRGYDTTEPSSALIKAILTGGANGEQPTVEKGWGRINLEESIYPSKASVYLYDRLYNNSSRTLLVGTFTITNSAAPFKAQLAWIDQAKTYGASTTLVMDHNLIVSNITQNVGYAGNDFDNDGVMDFDTVNNVEGVRIKNPTVGDVYAVYLTGMTTKTNKSTVPAIYVNAAAVDSAVDLAYHANISKATATWSTKDGITEEGGATLKGTSEDVIQLTNTVGNATVDFGSGLTAGSIAFLGSGTVELLCTGTPNVGTISAGSGLDAINLNNNLWPNTSFSIPDGSVLRYCGDTAMESFPFEKEESPCTIAIARAYTNNTDGIRLGTSSSTSIDQTFILENGADIEVETLIVGNGGTGRVGTSTVTQTGGSVTVTGSGDGTTTSGSKFFLGHWPCNAYYNLEGGTVSAPNAIARIGWDGKGYLTIGGGSSQAIFSAKGLCACIDEHNYGGSVTVKENGVLSVGASGVNFGSAGTFTLEGGTLDLADQSTVILAGYLAVTSASTIRSDGEATITCSLSGSKAIHIAAGTIAFPGILSSNPMTIADGAKVKIPLTSEQAALENVLLFNTTQTQEQLEGKIILVDSTTGDELDNTFVVSNGMVLLRNAVVEPLSGTVYLNGADYVAKMTANGYSEWLYNKAYEGDRHYIVTNLTEGYYAHIEKVPSKGIRLVIVKDKPEALWAGDFSGERQEFGDWKLLPNGNTVANGKISIIDSSHGGVVVSNVVGTIDHAMGLSVAATFTGVAANTNADQTLVAFRQLISGWTAVQMDESTGTHIATDGNIKGIWQGSQWGSTPTGSAYPTDGESHGYVSTYNKSGTSGFLDGTSGFSSGNLKATNADSSLNRLVSATIGGRHAYSSCNMTNVTVDALAVFTNVTFDATTAGAWRSYGVTVSNVTAGATLEGVYDVLKLTGGEVTINGTVCARAIDITGSVTLKGATNSCLRASAIRIASDANVTFSCTASEAATITVMDGRIVNGSKVTGSISGGSCATTATRDLVTIAFTPTTGATLHFGATDDGESLTVGSSTVAELVTVEGVTESNVDSIASNGLRVWQNAVLGITPADTTADEITLSITMNGSTPVVSTASGSLTTITLSEPTKELMVGEIKATATLQQADAPNAADTDWTVAGSTAAAKKFYRIVVTFETK
ncbi:MAG: S8 family serine peptidase [Kiritimatiellae bacterium]|nr:S8 family serine peptidase [Kiritimatiellia bacterium]